MRCEASLSPASSLFDANVQLIAPPNKRIFFVRIFVIYCPLRIPKWIRESLICMIKKLQSPSMENLRKNSFFKKVFKEATTAGYFGMTCDRENMGTWGLKNGEEYLKLRDCWTEFKRRLRLREVAKCLLPPVFHEAILSPFINALESLKWVLRGASLRGFQKGDPKVVFSPSVTHSSKLKNFSTLPVPSTAN